jgi:hypothetical protein
MGNWIDCVPLLDYNSIISTSAGYWVAKTGNLSTKPKDALQVTKPNGALRVVQCLSKVILVRFCSGFLVNALSMFVQHIALPAQIFAKVVPSIDASNIPALGTPYFHFIFSTVRVVCISFPIFCCQLPHLNQFYRSCHPNFGCLSTLRLRSGFLH